MAGMNLPTYAQSNTTSSTTTSDDVQVNLTITGVVKSVGPNSLTLNDDLVITIPAGTSIPAEVVVGVTITVTGQVSNDTFVAIDITIGSVAAAATAEPTEEATTAATVTATLTGTAAATATAAATTAGTQVASCGSDNTQPVAQRLANFFKVSYSEIMGWHCKGFGFGEIAKAYALALATANTANAQTAAQIFALRQGGEGRGQIMKQFTISPHQLAPGLAIRGGKHSDVTAQADATEKSHGNGNGNGNGGGSRGRRGG